MAWKPATPQLELVLPGAPASQLHPRAVERRLGDPGAWSGRCSTSTRRTPVPPARLCPQLCWGRLPGPGSGPGDSASQLASKVRRKARPVRAKRPLGSRARNVPDRSRLATMSADWCAMKTIAHCTLIGPRRMWPLRRSAKPGRGCRRMLRAATS